MKTAIGMMACIAIAFLSITSPESSRTQASSKTSIENRSDVLQQLQSSLDSRESMQTKILDELSQLKTKLDTETTVDLSELAKMREELRELRSEMDQQLKSMTSSVAGPATVQTSRNALASGSLNPGGISYGTSRYMPRWDNNDGLSGRDHAEKMHGINTAGLTDDQIAMMRDRDHDLFGPGHPDEMRKRNQASTGSQFISQRTRSSSTISDNYVPMQKYSTTSYQTSSFSTCPPGGCPGTQARSGGLLGFGLLGRKR